MLIPAVTFQDVVLAIHILAVVVAFGVTFAYPIIAAVVSRTDPRATPVLHRIQHVLGTRLITPGLVVVLIAGIYLASKEHMWSAFYVQWGLGAAIVLGGVGGAYMAPRELRLMALAERDVEAAGGGEVSFSEEYLSLVRQVAMVGAGLSLIVVLTVFFMALRLGVS